MPSDITFRQATQALAENYYGGTPPAGFRGWVALRGEDVVGVGGVQRVAGALFAFSERKPEMARDKRACAKATRLLVEYLDSLPEPAYAVADDAIETSAQLLARIGFVKTGQRLGDQDLLMRVPRHVQTAKT